MKRLLKGARVVDPVNGRDGAFDVLIDGGVIAKVGKDLPASLADGRLGPGAGYCASMSSPARSARRAATRVPLRCRATMSSVSSPATVPTI